MEPRLATIRIIFFVAMSGLILVMLGRAQAAGVYKGYEGPELPDEQVSILDWSGRNAPDVMEIDANRVSADWATSRTGPSPKRAKLRPGTHKIVLRNVARVRRTGAAPFMVLARFPISLNTSAGHTYLVKQTWHGFGLYSIETNFIWIEDATTGEVVAGMTPSSEEYSQPRSAVQMAQWRSLCRNAVDGDGSASSGIGSHYRHGWEPIKQNFVLAYKWFGLAVKAGYAGAAKYQDDVAVEMSPQQLAEAKQLIAEWTPDAAVCEVEGLMSSSLD